MDLVKGFVYNRGEVEVDGKKKHSYLVGIVIVCDEPLKNLSDNEYRGKNNLGGLGETVIAGMVPFGGLSDVLNSLQKYEPPHAMGDLGSALMQMKYLDLEELEKTNESQSKRRKRTVKCGPKG